MLGSISKNWDKIILMIIHSAFVSKRQLLTTNAANEKTTWDSNFRLQNCRDKTCGPGNAVLKNL